jgi:hypothetical protein
MNDATVAALAAVTSAIISGYSGVKAKRAERNSRPVANGFAEGVKTSLKGLESHLDDVHKDIRELRRALLDHLQNHP